MEMMVISSVESLQRIRELLHKQQHQYRQELEPVALDDQLTPSRKVATRPVSAAPSYQGQLLWGLFCHIRM